MDAKEITAVVHELLFGRGQQSSDYFIEQTPVSEILCYRDAEGREFDLSMHDDALAAAVIARFKELGVQIVRLGEGAFSEQVCARSADTTTSKS